VLVDILPTELSRESSEHFGNALGDVIKKSRRGETEARQRCDWIPSGIVTTRPVKFDHHHQ